MHVRSAVIGLIAGAGLVGLPWTVVSLTSSSPTPVSHVSYYKDGVPKVDFTTIDGIPVNGADPNAVQKVLDEISRGTASTSRSPVLAQLPHQG